MKPIKLSKVNIEAMEYTRCTIGGKVCSFKRNEDGFVSCSVDGGQKDSYGKDCPFAKPFTVLTSVIEVV